MAAASRELELEMEKEAGTKRQRVQLDFLPDAYARLAELRALSHARSIPDLIRTALRVYEWYLTRKLEGYKLQLVAKDGKVVPVDLML